MQGGCVWFGLFYWKRKPVLKANFNQAIDKK